MGRKTQEQWAPLVVVMALVTVETAEAEVGCSGGYTRLTRWTRDV